MTDRVERLEAYFDRAAVLFDAAVARAGAGPDRRLRIGGHAARLRFAGGALAARLLPAVRHLPDHCGGGDEFTVVAWDVASTGTALPPPPWEALGYQERGNVRAFDDDRFSLAYDRPTDVFSAVDIARNVGLYWTRDAEALPNYDTAAPMRRLLQGWLRSKGLFVVHAAAVGRPEGGILLAGRGGSGKSTTALLALEGDLLYAGDDFTLAQSDPVPYVHSLYNTAKLNLDALERMAELRPSVVNPDRLGREKAMLFLQSCVPTKLAHGFPLRAVVLPRVSGRRASVVTPASPLEAYRAVGPDTAFRTLGDSRGVLAMIRELVHALPCYHLALGTDAAGVLAALDGVLSPQVVA